MCICLCINLIYSDIKLYKNQISVGRVGPRGRTQGQTHTKEPTVAFINSANLIAKEIRSNLAAQMYTKHDIKIQASPYKSSFYCHQADHEFKSCVWQYM